MDASFVGLRGSPELERVIQRIELTPLAIVDAAARPKVPTMTGASQHGEVAVFYYDDNASAEPTGFWVLGKRTTRVSIHRPNADKPLLLQVHSGLIANRLHLSVGGWNHTMDLKPELPQRLEVPSSNQRLVTLELMTENAFVPMEMDSASRDERPLGAWVEVVYP